MAIIGNTTKKIRKWAESAIYGNAVYRAVLNRGDFPESIDCVFADSWPGDAGAGHSLIKGMHGLFFHEENKKAEEPRNVLSHEWLRDLRSVGTDAARRRARELLEDWLEKRDEWHQEGWAQGVLGDRLSNWIGVYEFYNPPSFQDEDFTRRLLVSMTRQSRYLARTVSCNLTGTEALGAIKGLLLSALSLREEESSVEQAADLLRKFISSEILPDGGHISRNPMKQMQVLRYFIDIRAILGAAAREVPLELSTAIERMVPALKLFRHGDDGLALFNGSNEGDMVMLEAVMSMSGAKRRVVRRLQHAGYERLSVGRSLLIADVGGPPPKPHDATAHAGLLSFEFSVGRERIIVNCGAAPEDNQDWRAALAATAAHSTLTLDDTNACEVLSDGGIGHRPKHVSSQRYEQEGVHYVEAEHDGYAGKYGAKHHRTLSISSETEELRGKEVLTGAEGRDYSLRWHLHPSVQASLLYGGNAALLRTPSGNGWRLKISQECDCGALSLEPGIYCGGAAPRRSMQLKISAKARAEKVVIEWILTREKKRNEND